MDVIPFIAYIALILVAWYAVGRILPGLYLALRRLGSWVAGGVSQRGLTEKALSFLPRHVLDLKPYAALILVVVIGLWAAFVAGDQFFDLAEGMRAESPTLLSIDRSVHEWTQENRHRFLTPFYLTFTVIGNPFGLALILLAGVAVSLLRRKWDIAIYLALTAGLGGLLNRWLKHLFGRDRPDLILALSDAAHESFPSGHTMGSLIVLGALAYASLRLTEKWRWKSFLVAAALITTITIAASRIYLGVHWISDIAAGLAAGCAWLVTSIVVFESYRQIWRRGKDAVQPAASSARDGRRGP